MNNIKCKFGNHKIGKDTLIFNMGPAKTCSARLKGMCEVINKGYKCYAEKAEIQYKDKCINARIEQGKYWTKNTSTTIYNDLKQKILYRRNKTKYFRFNESGDFYTQRDIQKLNTISKKLKSELNVTTYGYTARKDLKFNKVSFLIKGSNCSIKGSTGKTKIIDKKEIVPRGYIECPGNCVTCSLCKSSNNKNIAFRYH